MPHALEGYQVFKDGPAWCAVSPDYKNLQESPSGFGETPEAAIDELLSSEEFTDQLRRENLDPPEYEDFLWDCPRCHHIMGSPDWAEGCRDPQCPAV